MLDLIAPDSSLPATGDGEALPLKDVNDWVPHDFVLQDAWFPLAHAHDVGARPVRRSIYSHPVYLWREEGKAVAADRHPRETQSRAAVRYTDERGRYPVIEHYGYAWVWFGCPEAADIDHLPSLPFLPPKGRLPRFMLGTVRFDCAAPISLENLIDLTHADFLHADLIGDEKSESETVETFFDSETITMVRTCRNKSVAPVMKFFSGIRQPTQNVRQVVRIYLRSHCAIAYGRFEPGDDIPLFHPCVPETRDRTRMDYSMNTSHGGFLFKRIMPPASYRISRQDSYMTSPQSLRYMEPEKRRDLHSRFDQPGQRYRVLMKQLVERQARGDLTYREKVSEDCSDIIGIRRKLFSY